MNIRLLFPAAEPLTLRPNTDVNDLTVTHTAEGGIHTITLTAARAGICPEALEVSFPIPANLLTPAEDLLVYDNAAHTNDVSDVTPYTSFREKGHEFAELAVFKNTATAATYMVGLCTAHRFWSAFTVKEDTVTLRFELEGRELAVGEAYTMERTTRPVQSMSATLQSCTSLTSMYVSVPTPW